MSREQFEVIRPELESARKQTRPRAVDLYEVLCAVLYVLRSGCQWRTVYAYFQQGSAEPEAGPPRLRAQALKKSGERGPYQSGARRHNALFDRRGTEV